MNVKLTVAPVPSPRILNVCDPVYGYPLPPFSMYTVFNWLLFNTESPFSLTALKSSEVDQLFGRVINSVESNFSMSLGFTVNRYFQTYPSFVGPVNGSSPVEDGSSFDGFPVGLLPEDPLSRQI